jgi:hypothetical protein
VLWNVALHIFELRTPKKNFNKSSTLNITLFRFITMFFGTDIIYGIFPTFNPNGRIFHRILSIPKNIVIDLNNVMKIQHGEIVSKYFVHCDPNQVPKPIHDVGVIWTL